MMQEAFAQKSLYETLREHAPDETLDINPDIIPVVVVDNADRLGLTDEMRLVQHVFQDWADNRVAKGVLIMSGTERIRELFGLQ